MPDATKNWPWKSNSVGSGSWPRAPQSGCIPDTAECPAVRFLQAGRLLTVLSRDPLWPVLPRGCDPHAPGLVIAIWVSVGRGFSRTLVA